MKGNLQYCAACKKLLLKNVYMRPGCKLTARCFYCGAIQELTFGLNEVDVHIVKFGDISHLKQEPLTPQSSNDIIFISTD